MPQIYKSKGSDSIDCNCLRESHYTFSKLNNHKSQNIALIPENSIESDPFDCAEAKYCKPYYNVDSDIARRIQEDAHFKVLRDQQTTSRNLYHPDVIKNYPDLFNKSFFQ